MSQKAYLGIDLAKGNSKVAAIDEDGDEIVSSFSISNSREGVEKLMSKLYSYKKNNIVCAMEVSSNYWENMYSYLNQKDISCILLNPYQVKKYRQALGSKIKTDSIDAAAIASLVRAKKYDSLCVSDEAVLELRELVRIAHSFGRRVKDLKRSVLALLYLTFPEYTKIISYPFSKVSMQILSKYPTSFHMAKDGTVGRLVKVFRRYQGCNFGADKAKELIAVAKDSFYSGKAARSRGMSICMQIEEIASLSLKIQEIESEIKSILNPDDPKDGLHQDFDILNSIKGVGIGTIAAFIAAVGDVNRFSSSDKLVSFIGFYPKIFESGKYKKKNPTIVKAGPKDLRYMLYMSSVAAVKHNTHLKKYYYDMVSAGMPVKKALIKVAVKITRMMYSMLKHKQYYDPCRVFLQQAPAVAA